MMFRDCTTLRKSRQKWTWIRLQKTREFLGEFFEQIRQVSRRKVATGNDDDAGLRCPNSLNFVRTVSEPLVSADRRPSIFRQRGEPFGIRRARLEMVSMDFHLKTDFAKCGHDLAGSRVLIKK